MIEEHVVGLAVKYLEEKFAEGAPADLPGMLNYVDYYDRVVMLGEEVGEVLHRCPSVYVQRTGGRVIFTHSAGDRGITEEDMNRNVLMYHEDFAAMAKRLDKGSQAD